MNTLEMSTYCEPDFGLANEFINETMNDDEKEKIRKQTIDFYESWTDDDWADLGNNY